MSCWSRPLPRQASRWLRLALLASLLLAPLPAFAQNGILSGTVTDSATGLPITAATVSVITVNASTVATATTNTSGVYQLSVPPGALYYLIARGAPTGHAPRAYPDVSCINFFACSSGELVNAEPFSMPAGGTLTGRDFALTLGGTISGQVTNATSGAGVSSVVVTAWTRVGTTAVGLSTSSTTGGTYALTGLPPGTYYLYTSGTAAGLRNEIYDNVPCVVCSSALAFERGTPITVTSGATVADRNFALDPAGTISGTVTRAGSGTALQNVLVIAYRRDGTTVQQVATGSTNASGQYSIAGLPPGNYGVATASTSMANELYNDILCTLGCTGAAAIDSGHPVAVSLGSTVSGIDFALSAGGQISGTITNEVTGLPATGVTVFAVQQVGTNTFTRNAATNASGVYTISGLPSGVYTLFTSSGSYLNEIYDNMPCGSGACSAATAAATGALVPVTTGSTTDNRNFSLTPVSATTGTGTIRGTVTDTATGLPIAGIGLELWLSTGSGVTFTASATTGLDGSYAFNNRVEGSYRLSTIGIHPFRNEAYADIECLGQFCATPVIAAATPVALAAGGTTTANISLSAGDGVTGVVTEAGSGTPMPGVTVNVYQASGAFAGSVVTNRNGGFTLRHLPNGQYVAYTANSLGFFNEIYDNIRCTTTCAASTAIGTGTRISVTGAPAAVDPDALVANINFALDARTQAPAAPTNLRASTAGFTTQLTWDAPALALGAAATSYVIEAGVSPGTTVVTLPTTATSQAVPGVPPGTYFVRVRGVNSFGTGAASNEIVVAVGVSGTSVPEPPTNLLSYVNDGALTMTWSPSTAGSPSTGYVVEVGSTGGASNIATVPVAGLRFTYSPVPNGVYFFRVRSTNAAGISQASAEQMVVVGNVPAPPSAPVFTAGSASGSTVTLTWQAPTRGTATSYIVEAGSAPGLSNLARANIGAATTAQFGGVPAGTYFVRIRAVNAQGISVASNERTVTVQ